MLSKYRSTIFLLIVVFLLVHTGCRKEEATPEAAEPSTSTPETETAVPPTPTTPTSALELVPVDEDMPLTPKVVGQNPAPGEEAPLDGIFEVYFDQPMRPRETAAAWQVVDENGGTVTGEVSWPQPRVLRFKPNQALNPDAKYQATLAKTAVSAAGDPLLEGLTLDFYTIGNLAVSQISPVDGATDVALDSVITVIFNRPVVPLLIAEEQANLPDPLQITPETAGQGEWISTSVFVFRPDDPLLGRQTYTVRVQADVINEVSATGAQIGADYEVSFTVTAPTFNALELVDLTWSPRDNYRDVPLDQDYRLHFNQAMDPVSTENAVTLRPENGTAVPLQFSWDDAFTTATVTPTQLLPLDSSFTLRITTGATSASGGALRTEFNWRGNTVKSPAIINTEPGNGVTQSRFSSFFRIEFASPMDEVSLKGKVIITPPPLGDPDGQYSYWDWSLRFYGFEPSTTYTIEILPGMADPYGNEITAGRTITFTTAAYEPSASFNLPYMALFRNGGSDSVWVSHQNVVRLDVDLYQISLLEFGRLTNGALYSLGYIPGEEQHLWQDSVIDSTPLNQFAHRRFTLSQGGDPLPPGLYFITLDSPQIDRTEPHVHASPLIMSTANVTLKTTATEAMIWVTDLTTGQPLANVPVAFYSKNLDLLFEATTNADGLAYRNDLTLDQEYWETYYALAGEAGSDVFGLAMSNWSQGVSPYDFGISTDYYLKPNQPTVYVYTDRPIYRPGQPVYFKGIIRLNDDLVYSLPPEETVKVEIASFDETVYSEEHPISEYGSFTGEIMLDNEATLGSYRISVTTADNRVIGNGYFDVGEYRKPTFQVDVNAAASDVAAGDTIQLTINAEFFSGGSVVNGDVEWYVQSSPYTFTGGNNLSRYSFNSRERDLGYYYYYNDFDTSEIIAQGMGTTNSQGDFTLEIPADLSDEDGSRRFTIEATVTDIAGNQVSGRTNVIVHRSHIYPGIRASQSVGEAGKAMSFDVVAADWDGNTIPNQTLTLEVVERRWYSVQEEDDRGRTIWTTSVEEIPVEVIGDATAVTDENGRASVSFIPPNGGVFRAYVSVTDNRGNTARASTYVWVSGSDYVPWRRFNDHSFELISDADSYRPGDTAEILIASPFQGETYALVTVERGHIKQHEVVRLTSNSTIYRLPITAEMAPNVFVSVMVIKGVDETNLSPNFKLGMTQFSVERDEQELTVTIVPDKSTVGPGDTVNYTVRVTDFNGQPVEAEVSLSLSDLAALSLMERKERHILDHFYSERYLSVNTALLLAFNMDAYNEELEDEIKGGGGGAGTFGILSIRQDFPDTAYWNGLVQTDANGDAMVSITLPDNLTTWRMDARAVTLDTKVGQATVDILSTRPLLVSPQTPRFFIVGDKAQLGTAVHNNTDESLAAAVTLQAEGVTLNSPDTQVITIPPQNQAVVTWEVEVEDVERVDLVFSANAGEYADASRPVLGTLEGQGIPVYRYEVPETVGTSGQLLDGGAVVESIGLPIFPDFEVTQGSVTVEVAPSLAAAMTDGLTYLEHFPYECTEQIVSKFLPNLLSTRALQAAGINDPVLQANLDRQVNVALQRIYSRQKPDGGWPWWDGPNSFSNTLISAYVLLGLMEAKESGYQVSTDVFDEGVDYLRTHLRSADSLSGRFKFNRQAFLVYVLARAGRPPTNEINVLFENRESMDLYARGYLAQAIYFTGDDADQDLSLEMTTNDSIDDYDPRLDTLAGDFISSAILSATGANWEEKERDYWNWNSDTRTTAIVLDTMIKLDPQNPLIANAIRWLMAHRTNGRWHSTQETAWTLMALTNWMVASGELEADYEYEVALNGDRLSGGFASADTLRDPLKLEIDITDLLTEELNRLAIGRTDGSGNLYYTTHMEAWLPVHQVRPLDRGIIISRSYFDPADRETPITEIEQGQTFLARLTIVVPNSLHYVVIDDFLPAGLEAVDQSLKTSQQVGAPARYDWDNYFEEGWGWWYFNHVELRDEKVVLSAEFLPAGTYEYVYLVRAATPGEYNVIPPTAQEFYFPEVYGRGAGSLFVVLPPEG